MILTILAISRSFSKPAYYGEPTETKIIHCVDCGKKIEVNSKANNRDRCDECIQKAKLEKYRRYNSKRKKSNNLPPVNF